LQAGSPNIWQVPQQKQAKDAVMLRRVRLAASREGLPKQFPLRQSCSFPALGKCLPTKGEIKDRVEPFQKKKYSRLSIGVISQLSSLIDITPFFPVATETAFGSFTFSLRLHLASHTAFSLFFWLLIQPSLFFP